MTTTRHILLAILTGLLVFSLGCSDDDGENNPTIPGGGSDPAVELIQAEGAAMAQALVETLPELAGGALGSKSIGDAYYDETCVCWYWGDYEGNENSNPWWARSTNFSGAFFDGDTPQMDFEGADKIVLTMMFMYDGSDFSETTYHSKSIVFDMNLDGTGWLQGAMAISGTGTGHASGGTGNYEDEEWDGFFEEFDIDVDLVMPPLGCPTGTIGLATEEASFVMGFNGTGTATWTYKVGQTQVGAGTFAVGCGGM